MTKPVVLVSGGTFGLGLCISVELAKRGYQVIAFGLAEAQVSSTARGFESLERSIAESNLEGLIETVEADVSNEKDVNRVASLAIEKFGQIDGLVNNAAIGPLGTVLTTEPEMFRRILSVNVEGVYLMSRAVIPHMRRQGAGSIVNIGSGAGYGKPNMAAYAASKGAVLALSTAMAYDHFHDHIRVNVAIPGGGGIVSGMSVGRVGGDVAAFTSRKVPGTVAGRSTNGTDLANAVAFLLSKESEAITGTVIDVGCFANQGGPIPEKTLVK